MEGFVDLPGYEGLYKISENGEIFSLRKGRMLKSSKSSNGYIKVCVTKNGAVKHLWKHRLVALAFLGESNMDVNHKNHDKTDNRLENLEYVNCRENVSHYHNSTKKRDGLKTGAYFSKRHGKWYSRITVNKKNVGLGYFATQEEAANAYQNKLKELQEENRYVV